MNDAASPYRAAALSTTPARDASPGEAARERSEATPHAVGSPLSADSPPLGVNWLLLRGLAREARHWGDFPTKLAALPGVGRVLTLDLPGAGTEVARTSPTSIAAIVEDLRARFLPHKEATPGPWALFALSLGGMVTLDWIARHPNDFARAVVGNTSAADLAGPLRRLRPAAVWALVKALLSRDWDRRDRLAAAIVANTPEGQVAGLRNAKAARDAPMRMSVFFRQLWAASRARTPAAVSVPLLVVVGEGDRMVSPLCSHRLAQKLNAPLACHPDAGHELSLDAPEWLLQVLANETRAALGGANSWGGPISDVPPAEGVANPHPASRAAEIAS